MTTDSSISAEVVTARLQMLIEGKDLRIPSFPAAVAELGKLLALPSYSTAAVAKVVRKDPSLVAWLIRAANASARGGGGVVSLEKAVALVGADELMAASVATGVGRQALRAGSLATLRAQVWREALVSAFIGKELARLRRLPPEELFLCGLLHDFGKVVLLSAAEELLAADPRLPALPAERWNAIVEATHLQVNAVLARRWELPAPVADAMANHHAKPPAGDSPRIMIIRTADQIVQLIEAGRVTPAAIAAIAPLDAAEVAAVMQLAERLGASVSALSPPVATGAPSRVLRPVAERGHAYDAFSVQLQRASTQLLYRGLAASLDFLRVRGPEALEDNALVHVLIQDEGVPLDAWMRVGRCEPDGGAFVVELRPFGFAAKVTEAYDRIVRRAADAAAQASRLQASQA